MYTLTYGGTMSLVKLFDLFKCKTRCTINLLNSGILSHKIFKFQLILRSDLLHYPSVNRISRNSSVNIRISNCANWCAIWNNAWENTITYQRTTWIALIIKKYYLKIFSNAQILNWNITPQAPCKNRVYVHISVSVTSNALPRQSSLSSVLRNASCNHVGVLPMRKGVI